MIVRSSKAGQLLLALIGQMSHHHPNVRWLVEVDADRIQDRAAFEAYAQQGLVRFYVPDGMHRAVSFFSALTLYLDLEQGDDFPIEVLEATAVARACVVISRLSTRTLLEHERNAFILQETHPVVVTQQLADILNRLDDVDRVAKMGRESLLGRFHRQEAHERLLVLYDALIQGALASRAQALD